MKSLGKVNVKLESDGKKRNGGISPSFTARIHAMSSKEGGESRDKFEQQFIEVLNKVTQTIEKNEIRMANQDRREIMKIEWQQVAQVVDRLLLSCFVLITVALTCGVMMQAPS